MELLLPILGVGVVLMLLIHQEHLVEDMEKEEVIITDLGTIMQAMVSLQQGLLIITMEVAAREEVVVDKDKIEVAIEGQGTEVVALKCNP